MWPRFPLSRLSRLFRGSSPERGGPRSRRRVPGRFTPRLEGLEQRRLLSIMPGTMPLEEHVLLESLLHDPPVLAAGVPHPAEDPGEIHGMKWEDLDGDGLRDPDESPLENWKIYLDTNGNDRCDAGEPFALTDAQGQYAFTGLPPGEYLVGEVQQPGWEQTNRPSSIGPGPAPVFEPQPGFFTGAIAEIHPATGQVILSAEGIAIWFLKAKDVDGDGWRDPFFGGEDLANLDQVLQQPYTTILPDAVGETNMSSTATFGYLNLNLGNILLPELPITAQNVYDYFEFTFSWNVFGSMVSGPLIVTGNAHRVAVGPGEILADVDFGNRRLSGIQGASWEDLDGDGLRDPNEPGMAGVTVYLDLHANGQLDYGEPSDLTDQDGRYMLPDLSPGTYTVAEIVPENYALTFPAGAQGTHVVTLEAGQLITGIDFGNSPFPGEIHGTVWEDLDANGVLSPGEPAMGGVTVYLDLSADGQPDAGEPSALTDPDGRYVLAGVAPGSYTVAQVVPDNYRQTFPAPAQMVHAVVVQPGGIVTNIDFGNCLLPGEVRGTVWEDFDGDGTRDAGELGMADVTIYLDLDADGRRDFGEPSAPTNQDGVYSLTNVLPGTYTVLEVVPAGYRQTFPTTGQGPHGVTISPGETVTGIDFGNYQLPAEVHGITWEDLDGDHVRDIGEPGMPGVTIYLDLNYNGQLDPEEPRAVTLADDSGTPEDEAGTYALTDLAPDTYSVAQVVPDGYVQTFPDGSGVHVLALQPGDVAADINFGNSEPGEIRGTKWEDMDGDGTRDAGEPGMAGVTIYLDLDHDGRRETEEPSAVTNEDGEYALVGLVPNTYAVAEVVPSGYVQTFPSKMDPYVLTLQPGEVLMGIDFGNIKAAEIRGATWEDQDGDGVRDAGETGMGGVRIYLDLDHDGQRDADEPSTLTNADGEYALTDVAPGTYAVAEIVPSDYLQTFPAIWQGPYSVTVEAGQILMNIDFANKRKLGTEGEIRGTKWNDLDGNGLRGPGEPGLAGATIYLDLDRDGELDDHEPWTVTDADGQYTLPDVAPGAYNVAEVVPGGYEQTFPPTSHRTGELSFVQVLKDGQSGVDGLDWAHRVAVSPDGRHVYAAGREDNAVAVFSRDGATGELRFVEAERNPWGLNYPGRLVISPDGNHAYVCYGSGLGVLERNASTGELTFVQELAELDASAIALSPDGRHVYATEGNSLVVFSRVAASGRISSVQVLTNGQDGVDGLTNPVSVVVSPDGNYVYATTGRTEDTVATFNRNQVTGKLTQVQVLQNGQGSGGSIYPIDVAVSPDGAHVYIAGINASDVAAFRRDASTGELAPIQVLTGVDGLGGAGAVCLSPDGKNVYVAGGWDNRLVVFERDASTGRLSFVHAVKDNQDGVDGLQDVNSVTVSPDGRHVYATGIGDDAVAVFDRAPPPGQHALAVERGEVVTDVDFGNRPTPVPVVISDSSRVELESGTVAFEFIVTLTEASVTTVTVDYDTADGTATVSDGDYGPVNGTLTFTPGDTIKTATVRANGDRKIEADETFLVNLSNPTFATLADSQGLGTIVNDDWDIEVALVPVLQPSPSSLPGAALPGAIDAVQAGQTYYLELWARDTGKESGPVGITGGSVDLHYDTSATDALAVTNLDFDFVFGGTINDAAGLVDDLGGGTMSGGMGLGPDWARMAYVQFVANRHGEINFELSPGVFQFSRFGLSNVAWDRVGLPEPVSVLQIAGARVDMTLVRQPTSFDEQETGEVDMLPPSEPWIHAWEPFWMELWVSTPQTDTVGTSGGTLDLLYNTALATAAQIEYGPAFASDPSGAIDDPAGRIDDLGGHTQRTDVGDDRFALLGRIRFEPTAEDRAAVDERNRSIGPYDLGFAWDDVRMEVDGHPAGSERGTAPETDLYAVVYDIDENDLIDFGDLSFFAAAFGRSPGGNQPPYAWWADFDKSNFVDFGDLSLFAPNFAKSKPDADVLFHNNFPAAWSGGTPAASPALLPAATALPALVPASDPVDPQVDVRLVAVASPTVANSLAALPESLAEVKAGSTYYLEIWVQDAADPGVGVTGGCVDVVYTTAAADALGLTHGTALNLFARGTINDAAGLVDDFGGATLTAGVGLAPGWARLGSIRCVASAAGQTDFDLLPGVLQFSRHGEGNVAWEDVALGGLALTVLPETEVVGRHVFYDCSAFDGGIAGPNTGDDDAIATDKTALQPGQTATFANYTSYHRGINGIMIDVARPAATPTTADFRLMISDPDDPDTWRPAPEPAAFSVREDAGVGGSDRVLITWPDGAIRDRWLQVTVLAENLGLSGDDLFYFGNAVAESGNSDADARVTIADLLLARNNPRNLLEPAAIDFLYDFNRDGRVNATDVLLARNHQTGFLDALELSRPSEAAGLPAPASMPKGSPDAWAWLYEIEQIRPRDRAAQKGDSVEAAVDELLSKSAT